MSFIETQGTELYKLERQTLFCVEQSVTLHKLLQRTELLSILHLMGNKHLEMKAEPEQVNYMRASADTDKQHSTLQIQFSDHQVRSEIACKAE